MKIAIIHLSDIHMDEIWNYHNIAIEIATQINNTKCEKIIIVISGDLTFSGDEKQYDNVYSFLELIKNNLVISNDTSFIFVPGNHDIEYSDGETRERNILIQMTDVDFYNEIDIEMKRFKNYYSFCDFYDLPTNFISGKGLRLQFKDVQIDEKRKIRFYLLNNVSFSTYKATNNENSSGAVHVPTSLFDSINLEPDTVNFLVMHFPYYYFNESSYANLKKKMPLLSYVFSGHVHQEENIEIKSHNNLCSISSSPALYKDDVNRLGMAILIFDSSTNEITRYSYMLSNRNKFVKEDSCEKSFARCINGLNPLMKNNNFCDSILYSGLDPVSLNDCFVFPELSLEKSENRNQKISNIDSLISILNKKSTVIIRGSSQTGKTSMLYKMFF